MKGVHAMALLAVVAAEAALFWGVTRASHAWVFPRWFDQVQYLEEAYRGHDFAVQHGLVAGWWQTLTNVTAQGALHDFWAATLFAVTGPSRTAALALNLGALIAWQLATFFAMRRVTGSRALAWLAVGLIGALRCPWTGESGSMSDFRLDWMAACAYGVAVAAALAGDGFRTRRWAVGLGAAIGLVVLTRFLTGVYFVAAFGLLFGWLMLQRERWPRVGRLIVAGLVAAAVSGPVLWHSRAAIRGYYWTGHFDGPERALRASHMGPWTSVTWVLEQLGREHVGLGALGLGLAVLGVLAGLRSWAKARRSEEEPTAGTSADAWWLAGIFLAAPVLVLSAHELKAVQPVSIALAPVVWLVVLGCGALARTVKPGLVAATCGVAVLASGGIAVATARATVMTDAQVRETARINALLDYVYYRAQEAGLTQPRLAVTRVTEALGARMFTVLGYERHGQWLNFVQPLPTGIFETTREIVMQQLAASDFVCLVTGGDAAQWPFDRQLDAWRPETQAWCDAHLRHVADLEVGGLVVRVYEQTRWARPPEGVELAQLLAQAERTSRTAKAVPPRAPLFPRTLTLLGSTRATVAQRIFAAYDVREFRVTGLPAGLSFDAASGTIRGQFRAAGTFTATVTAVNAVGTTTGELTLVSDEKTSFARLSGPARAVAGERIAVAFEAFDAAGQFSFVDIIDLSDGKLLARLEANADEGQGWSGRHEFSLEKAGVHPVALRFVRFDAKAKEPYSFFDETREITVAPW